MRTTQYPYLLNCSSAANWHYLYYISLDFPWIANHIIISVKLGCGIPQFIDLYHVLATNREVLGLDDKEALRVCKKDCAFLRSHSSSVSMEEDVVIAVVVVPKGQ